jgi:hypothetical protein
MSNFTTLHPRIADAILQIDNLTLLNAIADPQLGDSRFVISEDAVYVYTSGGWGIVAAGAPSIGGSITGGTAGSVLFVGDGSTFAQDNDNFFWDDTDNRLGLGTSTPAELLEVATTASSGVFFGGAGYYYTDLEGGVAFDGTSATSTGVSITQLDAANPNYALTITHQGTATALRVHQTLSGSAGSAVEVQGAADSTVDAIIATNDTSDRATLYLKNFNISGPVLRLEGSTSGIVEVKVPNSFTSYSLTLPTAQGSVDQVLRNNGSGVLSWTTVGASIVSNAPTGNLIATDVQGALNELQSDVDNRQLTSEKGNANGYASLDGGGKVPVGQLPATLMTYEGTWDASTNTPTLTNGTGDAGMVYIVNGAGTVNFGAGNITFAIGDWVIYNGTIWQKSDNADDVMSVNGFTGVVVLDYDDVNAVEKLGTVVDNRIVRTDGVTGDQLQQSGITISDADAVSGITQLDVDNVRIDGNTISSTTGDVIIDSGANAVSITTANVLLRGGADLAFYDNDNSNAIVVGVPTNVTANRTPQIPDDSGNFVLTSAAQALTAKDIDGGTASDTSRLTVPKDTKTNLDALTRKEATVVYASDEDKLYVDNGSSLVVVGDGTGTGEVNLITTGQSDNAGWLTTGSNAPALSRTQTSGDLPLGPAIPSALQLTSPTLAGNETSDYAYRAFTIPENLKNTKLKVQFYMRPGANFEPSEWTVSVYESTNRVVLSTDSSGLSYLPDGNISFLATFDTGSNTSYTLRLTRRFNPTNNAAVLNVANVIVGPGQIVNVPAKGVFESFTPAWNGTPPTFSFLEAKKRRDNDVLEILLNFTTSSVGSSTAGFTLPDSLTILGGQATAAGSGNFGTGSGRFTAVSPVDQQISMYKSSTTSLQFISGSFAAVTWNEFASGDSVGITLRIPIAEWAGAPNYAGSNDVEYASSTNGTWTDAAAATNTVYGPQGSPITGGLGGNRTKTVRFQTPTQTGEVPWVELLVNGTWIRATAQGAGYQTQISANFGVRVTPVSSSLTDYDVIFYQIARPTGATYGSISGGTDWNAVATAWRLVRGKAGAAVGFGAATQTSLGLVKAGQVPGTNTNDSAVAGNVGEYIESKNTSLTDATTSAQWKDAGSITLTPGDWDIDFYLTWTLNGATVTLVNGGIGTATGNNGAGIANGDNYASTLPPTSVCDTSLTVPTYRVSISTTTTYYGKARATYSAGTPRYYYRLSARRVR